MTLKDDEPMFMPFGIFESTIPVMLTIIIVAFIAIMLQWGKDNKIIAQTRAVTKRINTCGGTVDRPVSTSYYITFEFLNGGRTEFLVTDKEYGLIAERDEGMLTFQKTKFISFERILTKCL